ncbi:MAG: hypothetical protein ABL940_11910 [Bacteroidia bacterium]
MIKLIKHTLLSLIGVFMLCANTFGQARPKTFIKKYKIDKADEKKFAQGEDFFEQANYLKATQVFAELSDANLLQPLFAYRTAVCMMYEGFNVSKAITYMERAYKRDSSMEHINYFMARAYHMNAREDDAIKFYTKYLNSDIDVLTQKEVKLLIQQCQNAQAMALAPVVTTIKNLGPTVNSAASEYVPVITTDESLMLFTYRGPRSKGGLQNESFKPDESGNYYEDVFQCNKLGTQFDSPEPLGDDINSLGHDACIGISFNGDVLFLFKSTAKNGGDIYTTKINGETWGVPVALDDNINTKAWEGSASITSDMQTLYFASERPGGFGGRDIYKSTRNEDGTWGVAQNLGKDINTELNDDAPFIHPDGVTLYFSSEGHNSIGGYDIFRTNWFNNEFTTPENLGMPINTAGDDIYFVIDASGTSGYYSSGRAGGLGQQDIYSIDMGQVGKRPILAVIKGTVVANGKTVAATIKLENISDNKKYGDINSNASTGKYLFTLMPGVRYKVTYSYEGYEPYTEYVDTKLLSQYVDVLKDVDMADAANNKVDSTSTIEYLMEKRVIELKMLTASTDINNSPAARAIKEMQDAEDEENRLAKLATDKSKFNTVAEDDTNLKNKKQFTTTFDEATIAKYVGKSLNNKSIYTNFLADVGTLQNEKIIYKVQIGAYRHPQNFKYDAVQKIYGQAQITNSDDGITRFTLKEYNTIAEAEVFRQEMIQRGITDAWITAVYEGKRVTLEELIAKRFYINKNS